MTAVATADCSLTIRMAPQKSRTAGRSNEKLVLRELFDSVTSLFSADFDRGFLWFWEGDRHSCSSDTLRFRRSLLTSVLVGTLKWEQSQSTHIGETTNEADKLCDPQHNPCYVCWVGIFRILFCGTDRHDDRI